MHKICDKMSRKSAIYNKFTQSLFFSENAKKYEKMLKSSKKVLRKSQKNVYLQKWHGKYVQIHQFTDAKKSSRIKRYVKMDKGSYAVFTLRTFDLILPHTLRLFAGAKIP